MSLRYYLLSLLLILACLMPVSAQKPKKTDGQTDSVVVLMNAKSARLMEKDGEHYREVIDGRFLHNNTYLICDTALWNVDREVINAVGHVRIIQENTELSSETLEYVTRINLARFRGKLVELKDKEGNVLRTRYLDYNTKDSTAYFERGAAMRSKDGQVIESQVGEYDSKISRFVFSEEVNMYTDSVFVRTNVLYYHSDTDVAEFKRGIDAWKDGNMISSDEGMYERSLEKFYFQDAVHIMSETQEGWADTLYFDRRFNDLDMRGNVQVIDTTRHVSGLSDRLVYVDTLSRVSMTGNAVVIAETDQNGQRDTVYFGADRLTYHTVPRCDVPSEELARSDARLSIMSADPVSSYRKVAAEEAAKEEEQKRQEANPNPRPVQPKGGLNPDEKKAAPDEEPDLSVEQETESSDSLATDAAALEALKDTTEIAFVRATGNVRMFKSDIQMVCDSLEYTDLDSLAQLFISPVIWNEANRQYSSDSVYIAVSNNSIRKADLISNGFIIIEEEEGKCYDQIRGAEIMAHFDTTSALQRFDALGGASALFFLKENDAFATVNKVESKMLSANFTEGEISRIHYYDSPKNDAYPLVQMPEEDRRMKGFNWTPERRPAGREDITTQELRPSEREAYSARAYCNFVETGNYFPGYIQSVYRMLESRDSLRAARRLEAAQAKVSADSLDLDAAVDSLAVSPEELLPPADSLAMGADDVKTDSLAVNQAVADSLANLPPAIHVRTPAEIKAEKDAARAAKRAESEAKRQARLDARQERWDALDARDAVLQAKKDAKNREKQRKRTLRAVIAAEKSAARDQKKLDRYLERYRAKKEAEGKKLLEKVILEKEMESTE